MTVATLTDRQPIVRNPLFVDGVTRSGKQMHAAVISSFRRCEMWQSYPLLEDVPVLHKYCGMPDNVAIWLIQREVETELLQTFMGRRINLRFDDTSSIWRSRDPQTYLKRLGSVRDQDFVAEIAEADPIMMAMTHEVLCHVDIVFDALPQTKIVWGRRHPVDLAYSWCQRGWGERFGRDPRSTFPAFDGPAGPLPWHALGFADEYLSLLPTDRVIRSLEVIEKGWVAAYDALSDERRSHVSVLTFEQAVTDDKAYIGELSRFLDSEPSDVTPTILAREKVPRVLDKDNFDKRLRALKEDASPTGFERLVAMVRVYEQQSRDRFGFDVAAHRRHTGGGTILG